MDAAMLVEDRVRDVIRQRGLDPLREPRAVEVVIDQVLAEYVEEEIFADRSFVDDPIDIAKNVLDAVAGFGPLQKFFDDPQIEEVWINAPGRVFIARQGRSELTTTVLSDAMIRDLVERMLRWSGRRLDVSSPFVDAMLPDGSRLHVVIPDITRSHWAVNIRRFVVRANHVRDLVALGTVNQQIADFLAAAVESGLNIVIAGGTQSGKTTMLNSLLGCVPKTERIISCEEVFEVQVNHPDWVALQTRDAGLEGNGQITLRRLVREALRMRPTRLIVGEVRQEEALDLLVAMNSGMPAMATLHANSAREAITKLCTLPLLAGANIAADFVVPTVAGCVDLVVHVATAKDGRREVREITGLPGRIEAGVVETSEVFRNVADAWERGNGFPPHPERFERHGFNLAQLLGAPTTRVA